MIRRFLLAAACVFSIVALRAEDAVEEPKAPAKVVQAAAAEEVKALVGQNATVEGKVGRIGSTAAGGITFINLAPGANGFVAVVFKADYGKFEGGFDKYKGQTIRVTGPLVLFKEATPQIVVKSPDQIEIVPGAPEAPKEGE